MLRAACCVLRAACCVLRAACSVLRVPCSVLRAACKYESALMVLLATQVPGKAQATITRTIVSEFQRAAYVQEMEDCPSDEAERVHSR